MDSNHRWEFQIMKQNIIFTFMKLKKICLQNHSVYNAFFQSIANYRIIVREGAILQPLLYVQKKVTKIYSTHNKQ